MSGQKPMWQRMKEKFEEEERLEKEREENKKKKQEEKIRKILNELDKGSIYVFRESEHTMIEVSGEKCMIPKASNNEPLFSKYVMTTVRIGDHITTLTLPLRDTNKWVLLKRTLRFPLE